MCLCDTSDHETPKENNSNKGYKVSLTLSEQKEIDETYNKVDWIVQTLLAKTIEKKDYTVFRWAATKGGFEPE